MSIGNYSRKRAVKLAQGVATRFQRKPLVCAVALALVSGVVLPATGGAATLQGQRFIDKSPIATIPMNTTGESKYAVYGYIVFKPLNSQTLSQFSTPVVNGDYLVQLADGEYEVWQYVDSALLTPSQLATVQWANTTNPNKVLKVAVSGNSIITQAGNGVTITGSTLDFPFPDLGQSSTIPSIASSDCNEADPTDRKIICGVNANLPSDSLVCDHNYPMGTTWPATPVEFKSKRVFVYGDVEVNGSLSNVAKVASLCNHGTLRSDANGNDVKIQFARVFVNFEDGKIIGANAVASNKQGASIQLLGRDSMSMTSGILVNQGVIKAGSAFIHSIDGAIAVTFEQSLSNGGSIAIDTTNTYQFGTLLAGQGSEIRFSDFWAAWDWEHHAGNAISGDSNPSINLETPSSKGGNAHITGTQTIVGNSSTSSGGRGGSIVIVQSDDCGNNPEQDPWWCLNEIKGGPGGNLELLTTSVFANDNTSIGQQTITALTGNSVYVEPDTIEISGNTTITADEDVVIFGGDNYILRMTALKENAITAGRNIILAVGNGGTIDLRGISTKALKAVGKIEVYADNLILDEDVMLEDLVGSGVIVRGGNKIIYHAVFSGSQSVASKVGETVPLQLTLHNGGPKSDTYTLAVTNQNGLTVSGLPTTLSIEGLKQTELNLNVTPSTAGDRVITVTATSQTDPTVVATMQILTTVVESVVSTRTLFGTLKDKYGKILAGATVQVSDKTTTTDENGYWEITGMVEGNYTVTATKDNFVFLPASLNLSTTSVAKQEIKLVTDREPYDVWVSDPSPDNGSEPSKTTWIWTSPDVWVRNQDDNGIAYQNVVFGQDNYVYVRARNRGTLPIQNTTVEVYRSGASMGSAWPRGWELVGTANVAELQPGASDIVHIKWAKDKIAKPGHYCFYTRLLNDQDPMFSAETNDMVGNTFKNNNIAWRNFNVVGLLTKVTDKFEVNVGNPINAQVAVDLVFDEPENLLQNDGARAIVDLGTTLFQRWQQAGGQGENIQVLAGTTLVQLLATPAKFVGITLEAEEELPITLRVDAFEPAPGAGTSREYHFTTQEMINGELVGGVDYAITTRAQDTDSDGDGIKDVVDDDNDNDGISDEWEIKYGLNPLGSEDAEADSDGDGISNKWEIQYGLNPLDKADANEDTDGDEFSNLDEFKEGSDPTDPSSKSSPEQEAEAYGTLEDRLGNRFPNVTIKIGDRTTVTDEQGKWKIDDLAEGNYTVSVTQDGYLPISLIAEVGNDQPYIGDFKLVPLLSVQTTVKPSIARQDENITYTLKVTNKGTIVANNIVLEDTLPAGTELLSAEINGGTCEASRCTLTRLLPGETTQIKFVVSNTQTNKLENRVVVTSDEYPTDTAVTWTTVVPYLSVSLSDTPDPIPLNLVQGEALRYTAQVNLDALAPTPANGVNLKFNLPNGLTFKAVNTDKGTCDSSGLPAIACQLTDLEVGGRAVVTVDTQLRDLGLLTLTADTQISANNYPLHTDKERTTIQIPPGIEVDMALVIDDTGSMQQEIDSVKTALQQFIAEINPNESPLIAFITFKDEATVRFFGRDLNLLLQTVKGLKASDGGMCPEASVEALNAAIPHVKQGGTILFVTDASPYDDADLEKLAELLRSKAIRLNSIVTGDCSNQDSWNTLEESQ